MYNLYQYNSAVRMAEKQRSEEENLAKYSLRHEDLKEKAREKQREKVSSFIREVSLHSRSRVNPTNPLSSRMTTISTGDHSNNSETWRTPLSFSPSRPSATSHTTRWTNTSMKDSGKRSRSYPRGRNTWCGPRSSQNSNAAGV